MALLDAGISAAHALVIDGHAGSRATLIKMLQTLDIDHIMSTGHLHEARKLLEIRRFDIVLCDYHFEGQKGNGQELVEDLRRANLLPFSTSFMMVTAENSYHRVAEAAESALDSYLLKPHSLRDLAERLVLIRLRKQALRSIFDAMEAQDHRQAAELCLARFHARGAYWLYAARLGAELLLRLKEHDAARTLYEAICDQQALPWARLGVARAHLDQGKHKKAEAELATLVEEHPDCSDAFDVMGRAQMESSQFEQALLTYQKAVQLTPSSISRLQKLGLIAFYLKRHDVMLRSLLSATQIGARGDQSSRLFNTQTLVILGFWQFAQRDVHQLRKLMDCLLSHELAHETPDLAERKHRQWQVMEILLLILERQTGSAVASLREHMASIQMASFDLEAASNALGLLARLSSTELKLADAADWVHAIARRFCSTPTALQIMCMSAQAYPPYVEIVQQAYKEVRQMAEESMAHALKGAANVAVSALLSHALKTLNVKLLDLAEMVLHKHREHIQELPQFRRQAQQLRDDHGCINHALPMFQMAGRDPGGLRLRA
jgi:DNA-binding NarL/FixJ family response regulator